MDKNFDQISQEQLQKIASSPMAQALMAMLRQNHSSAVDSAMKAAQQGDMQQAQKVLAALMKDPQTQKMIRQLQENSHG